MAFRRCLSIRATLLARRFNPSFSYISHLANDQSNHEDLHSTGSIIENYSTPRRSFGTCTNCAPWQFTGAFCRTGYGWVGNGLILKRQMSTSFRGADTTDFPDEVPTLITDDVDVVISDAPIQALTSQSPAILNMVEKVPSFKNGGALWFTDLTTPDAMYIFPILTALILLVQQELYSGLKLNPKKINFAREFIPLFTVLSASFPQAIFCYWYTSILFNLCWRFAMRDPRFRKALGIWKVQQSTSSANSSDMSKDK